MTEKKGDGVPTIGTKNIGRQKNIEVESAEELAPTGRGTTKLQKNDKTAYHKNQE